MLWVSPGQPFIANTNHPYHSQVGRRPLWRSRIRRDRKCSICFIQKGFKMMHHGKSLRLCLMMGITTVRYEPCIGFSKKNMEASRSVVGMCSDPLTRSQSCLRLGQMRFGLGILQSCLAPRSGHTTISTSSWTSSVATLWDGWWRIERAQPWQRNSSRRPVQSSALLRANLLFTRIGARP
jgi:hypothetical protein